jgi:hypothetical protein
MGYTIMLPQFREVIKTKNQVVMCNEGKVLVPYIRDGVVHGCTRLPLYTKKGKSISQLQK